MPGRVGADLRPDLRGREAPPPQARRVSRSGQARRHQRAVCEGCGDCSVQVELPVGRAAGDRVRPQARRSTSRRATRTSRASRASARASSRSKAARCKKPQERQRRRPTVDRRRCPSRRCRRSTAPYGILVTGIGGTGVVTIGALLGMAAHLEGKGVIVLDMTGLAQKDGAVMSHVRIARRRSDCTRRASPRAKRDLVLGCDLDRRPAAREAIAQDAGRHARAPSSTRADIPTAEFVAIPTGNSRLRARRRDPYMRRRRSRVGRRWPCAFVGDQSPTALMGDSIATNMFMLGYAWQKGWVPLSRSAIDARDRAERRGGRRRTRGAFAWGRRAADDRAAGRTRRARRPRSSRSARRIARCRGSLDELIERRVEFLTGYQDAAYAAPLSVARRQGARRRERAKRAGTSAARLPLTKRSRATTSS